MSAGGHSSMTKPRGGIIIIYKLKLRSVKRTICIYEAEAIYIVNAQSTGTRPTMPKHSSFRHNFFYFFSDDNLRRIILI